ncbi:hypothetical protein RCL1_004686 [Eukaryota sp. TZLM3-RCL]
MTDDNIVNKTLFQLSKRVKGFQSLLRQLDDTSIQDDARESFLFKLQDLMTSIESDILSQRLHLDSAIDNLNAEIESLDCDVNHFWDSYNSWNSTPRIFYKKKPLDARSSVEASVERRKNTLLLDEQINEETNQTNLQKTKPPDPRIIERKRTKIEDWKRLKWEREQMSKCDQERRILEERESERVRTQARQKELKRIVQRKKAIEERMLNVYREGHENIAKERAKQVPKLDLTRRRQQELESARERSRHLDSFRQSKTTPTWERLAPPEVVVAARDPNRLLQSTVAQLSRSETVKYEMEQGSRQDSGFILHSSRKTVPVWRRGL